jgi:hypothetical protein
MQYEINNNKQIITIKHIPAIKITCRINLRDVKGKLRERKDKEEMERHSESLLRE